MEGAPAAGPASAASRWYAPRGWTRGAGARLAEGEEEGMGCRKDGAIHACLPQHDARRRLGPLLHPPGSATSREGKHATAASRRRADGSPRGEANMTRTRDDQERRPTLQEAASGRRGHCMERAEEGKAADTPWKKRQNW